MTAPIKHTAAMMLTPGSRAKVTPTARASMLVATARTAIVPKENAEVPVLIWEIDGRDEHSLDKYEGFPNYYRKELFEIDVNGEKKECMAYLMNNGHISPPMSYYYNVIKQGYEANGMDTSYLRAALEKSVCEQYFDEEMDEEFDEDDDLQMKL